MASRVGLLRYPGDLVLMPKSKDKWLLCKISDDNFWDREPVTDASSFKPIVSNDEEEDATPLSHFICQIAFGDHNYKG